ncbi:hypothetical protein [Spiroplasma sp. BIUS-1]|uniref:hypothetical protein n=1 Tax=Spiroplasma sp. BIUS-1 TaxID=216964 RepID=UPI00139945EF|nr:hypothetical protein [Spiroplasma sp. BIUS-1]QHX36439.1 hypothetical protein SBIUS_v1c01860 [Spiroplasma sp. BIUS-1]
MKKLLSLFGTLTLSTTSIAISTQVVSCNATWSGEFQSIIDKDVEKITGKDYFDIKEEKDKQITPNKVDPCKPGSFYSDETNPEPENPEPENPELPACVEVKHRDVNVLELKPSELINNKKNEVELKKITDNSLELFKEASTYFDSIVPDFDPKDEDGNDYYYYVLDDKNAYGNSSKLMNYESQKNILDFYGDAIINPLFQKTAVQFAVLRKNLAFTQYFEDTFLKNPSEKYTKEYISEVEYMNNYLTDGWFVPMFKIIRQEKVISQGNSMTKMKFDKHVVSYFDVGSKSSEYLKKYEGYWFTPSSNNDDWIKGIILADGKSPEKDVIYGSKPHIAARINDYEVSRLYNYGFTELGGHR